MHEEPERIQRVNEVGDRMRRGFQALGFDTGPSVTPIIPIMIGDTMRTIGMWKGLFDAGVFVNPILSPAVPEGQELLRTSYMATHTDEQLDQVLSAFEAVGRNLEVI
jgi:8-amino-7-oxononanoate synthase